MLIGDGIFSILVTSSKIAFRVRKTYSKLKDKVTGQSFFLSKCISVEINDKSEDAKLRIKQNDKKKS